MKVAERTIERESTVAGTKVDMSIDPDAFAHIMSVLTDLYSDPELAVIREYSTNAWDSHVEAGVDRPIEVTLPSPLSPFLSIRDYGVGLDAEGIHDTYSRYGASTKRNSNDVVGMLGLGCKSALTYVDQFTVVGRKDGREIQVAIGRDEDGTGSMTIVSDEATSEPNGVEVIVPAKRENAMVAKAKRFFSFWPEGRVLLNGEPPERIDGMWITDNIVIPEAPAGYNQYRNEGSAHIVVMGGVPYPIPRDLGTWPQLPNGRYAVIFVEIGEVNFTPSRESLQATRTTKDTIERVSQTVTNRWHASLAEVVAKAKTPEDAVLASLDAQRLGLPPEKAIWNGHRVSTGVTRKKANGQPFTYYDGPEVCPFLTAKSGQQYYRRGSKRAGDWTGSFAYTDGPSLKLFVFTGWEGATLTNTKRAKVEQYLARTFPGHTEYDYSTQQSVATCPPSRWVFVPDKHKLTEDELRWIDPKHVIPWATVDAEKLPKAARGARHKVTGSYWWTTPSKKYSKDQIEAEAIDPTKAVYIQGNYYAGSTHPVVDAGLVPDDFKIICLEANRLEKFKRDFPSVPHIERFGKDSVKKMLVGLDSRCILAAWYGIYGDGRILSLDPNRLDDPALKAAHDLAALATQRDGKKAMSILRNYRRWINDEVLPASKGDLVLTPLEKYPLVPDRITPDEQEHVYLYINAAHAAEGEDS